MPLRQNTKDTALSYYYLALILLEKEKILMVYLLYFQAFFDTLCTEQEKIFLQFHNFPLLLKQMKIVEQVL